MDVSIGKQNIKIMKNNVFWHKKLSKSRMLVHFNRWFFSAPANQNGEVCIKKRLRNLFECILTKSDAWLFDSKWSSFFDNQSLDNQYHILSQSFSICCICVNSTILAFCLSTKINKMCYHFDIWVGTSQLSPNPFLFPTITVMFSVFFNA